MGGIFSKAKQNELAMKINYGEDADDDDGFYGERPTMSLSTPSSELDFSELSNTDSIASTTKSIVELFSTSKSENPPQTQIAQPPPSSTLAFTKSKNDLDYQTIAFSLLVALLFISFLFVWFVFQVQRIRSRLQRIARARNSLIRQKSIKQIHVDHEINFVIVDFTDGTQKHFFG